MSDCDPTTQNCICDPTRDKNCISSGSYFTIYFILVVLVFFLLYLGFSYTLNEAEAFTIALIAGLVYLAVLNRSVGVELANPVQQSSQYLLVQFLTWLIITFTIVFTILVGIGFFTFGKTYHDRVYFRSY